MGKKWSKEERLKLFEEAFQAWGAVAQVDMLVEELSECILATQKLFKRDYCQKRLEDLASEFADVEIMTEQIEYLLTIRGPWPKDHDPAKKTFRDLVKEQKEFKLTRARGRVDKALGKTEA